MPSLFDTARHERLIAKATREMDDCNEVIMAWLEGPLTKGCADRYTCVELFAAVEDDNIDKMVALSTGILERLGNPIMVRERSDGRHILNVLYDNGVSLRLIVEKLSQVGSRTRESVRILVDKDSYAEILELADMPRVPVEYYWESAYHIIGQFWHEVSCFPALVRRGYPVAMCQSVLGPLRKLTLDVMVMSRDPWRSPEDSLGLLSEKDHEAMERTSIAGNTLLDAWSALVEIGKVFASYSREACRTLGVRYPDSLELSVRSYVYSELSDRLPTGEWWNTAI